jgi:sugar/nucleoside kinase (ribokinase family)
MQEEIIITCLQVEGGGNTGNALTGASRLGLTTRIITKVLNLIILNLHKYQGS